jgi:predicted double-glycine peptidase
MKNLVLCCWLLLALDAQAAELAGMDGGRYTLQVVSLKAARFQTTVHQQYDFSCGSAALATLLSYHYDHPVSEAEVFQSMFALGDQQKIRREGFSLLDMKRYLASQGFAADGFEQPLEKLAAAGYPAIVLLSERGYHHFVVVKGVQGGRVLLGDPASGTRAMRRSDFEAAWLGRLLFVIHGWQGPIRFNQRADWRVAPRAFADDAINRTSLSNLTLPKLGRGDF